jgi:endonuclease/exonuclease/phosphatase (EEP) superfamily protein YafD
MSFSTLRIRTVFPLIVAIGLGISGGAPRTAMAADYTLLTGAFDPSSWKPDANIGAVRRTFDRTPPSVRLTSYNLAPELDQDSEKGPVITSPGAPGADALVGAEAVDAETGVSRVEAYGEMRVLCGATPSSVENLTSHSLPLSAVQKPTAKEGSAESGGAAQFPTRATALLLVPLSQAAGLCPGGSTLVDVEVDLHAEAINGVGFVNNDAQATIANGPVSLKVSTHNASGPCLAELETPSNPFNWEVSFRNVCEGAKLPFWATPEGPAHRPKNLESVLDAWGQSFATEDVVMLSEMDVANVRWLNRIVSNMPGFFVAHRGDTVVLSRFPISDIRTDEVTTSYTGQGVGPFNVSSRYTRATIVANGRPMVVYAVHWAHRPSGPETSSNNRQVLANRMVADIAQIHPRIPVLVGGDFNAKLAFAAPGDLDDPGVLDEYNRMIALHSGSMPEMATMEAVMRNARAEVFAIGDPLRYVHGFGHPVDHLFVRGPYRAVAYTNFAPASPSDHPRLAFELARGL